MLSIRHSVGKFLYYRSLQSPRAISKNDRVMPTCRSNLRPVKYSTWLSRSTIFALSSGAGKCGVAVFRISGPLAKQAIKVIAKLNDNLESRKAHLRKFYHPLSGEELDRGLLLWFPGPNSFTGEDCFELHVHGGPAVVSAIADALGSLPGLRFAEPGEFTRRSFQNGKLDLTEVEGLADLIHAETEAQRRQALRQMDGALSKLYMKWRNKLLQCTAHLEAYIDFSEEENIEEGIIDSVHNEIFQLEDEIKSHLADDRCGERIRSGLQTVIVGEPNVGKSSLLNALCQRPVAIVSPVAGTTRDVLETSLNISGYSVIISDTAGLHETDDVVEREGVKRAVERAKTSDLIMLVVDSTEVSRDAKLIQGSITLDEFVSNHLKNLRLSSSQNPELGGDSPRIEDAQVILVLSKRDLLSVDAENILLNVLQNQSAETLWCTTSCQTENGLEEFLKLLTDRVKRLFSRSILEDRPNLSNSRHRHCLTECKRSLTSYREKHVRDSVLGAQDLRRAMHQIGKITGHVTLEDVLDIIFRDFCIGK